MDKKINNLFSLAGKIVVITGAAGLLGKKHAEAIAAYEGTPVLVDLSQSSVDVIAKKLNKKYKINSIGFSIDITNESNVELVSKKFLKSLERLMV